jgi:hypothetical protein
MSATRIGIIAFGLVAMLILGTWGWTELANAVYRADANDVVVALTVYGVAFLVLAVGAMFTFFVLWFRNNALR